MDSHEEDYALPGPSTFKLDQIDKPLLSSTTYGDNSRKSPTVLASAGSDSLASRRQKLTVTAMLQLTCGVFGLQLVWSVIMSSGTPYLRSLGLSTSLTALVWLSDPLAGSIVQPVVGAYSDRCRSRWGRRKPYMVGGAICTIFSLLALAWTKDAVHKLVGMMGASHSNPGVEVAIQAIAVAWVYVLNSSLQPVQAGIRAFIVDNCPQAQQVEANAWAGKLTGLGNALGYLLGMADLPTLLPFLGNTEFKVQCVMASMILTASLVVCCTAITERDNLIEASFNEKRVNARGIFSRLYRSVRKMPPTTQQVCKVQFFSWMGWFPFLFYTTSYISELYSKPLLARVASAPSSPELIDLITERSSRIGASGSFSLALVSLIVGFVAPLFVRPLSRHPHENGPRSVRGGVISLPRLWRWSLILFSACMFATIFVTGQKTGTVLVALAGISWAMTTWAPFALISSEISELQTSRERMAMVELEACPEIQAGVVIGLHNVAIASPQIASALICSGIFEALKASGVEDSLGWVLRCAGIPALFAAYLAIQLDE